MLCIASFFSKLTSNIRPTMVYCLTVLILSLHYAVKKFEPIRTSFFTLEFGRSDKMRTLFSLQHFASHKSSAFLNSIEHGLNLPPPPPLKRVIVNMVWEISCQEITAEAKNKNGMLRRMSVEEVSFQLGVSRRTGAYHI